MNSKRLLVPLMLAAALAGVAGHPAQRAQSQPINPIMSGLSELPGADWVRLAEATGSGAPAADPGDGWDSGTGA